MALNVTVVTPRGKIAGASCVTEVIGPSTLSSAVALNKKVAIAESVAAVPSASTASTVILAGGVTTGASGSWTLILRVTSWAGLPAVSLTL